MTKQQLDVEKLFGQSFDDFAPKTSSRFNTKMAKRLGLASVFGFAISSSLAKAVAAFKAIAFETIGFMKTVGIVKSIAVVTVVSTTIATPLINKKMEKANEEAKKQTILLEKRKANHGHLPMLEMKTTFINLTDLISENMIANDELIHHHALHNELVPKHTYRDHIQLAGIASKETKSLAEDGDDHHVSSQLVINSTKENTIDKTKNIREENSKMASVDNDGSNTDIKKSIIRKQNTTLFSRDISSEKEVVSYIKSKTDIALKINKEATNSIYINDLQLTVDIPEESSNKNFFSDVHLFGEIHFMPFSYHNLSTIKPLTNDTIVNQFIQESPQLSYQFGFDIRMQKEQNPWFVNLGINYQRVSEQVDYYFVEKTIGYWDYDTTSYYVINPPFVDTILNVDSAYMVQWEGKENSIIHTNSYHYLNVPIKFGYEFFRKKKFSLQVSTGIEMAVRVGNSGYIYNSSGQIIDYADANINPSIDWYYLASFGLNYQMNKTTLFILPSIKYQLNTRKTNPYPKEHKYFIYGLKFGIRFKLF